MSDDFLSSPGTYNPPDTYGMGSPSGRESPRAGKGGQPPAKKAKFKCLILSKGYIRFKPGSTSAEKMKIRQLRDQAKPDEKDKVPKIIPDTWHFTNEKLMGKSIQLYGSQATNLIKRLPDAYKAFLHGDTSYYLVLDETKTQKLTLEVYTYNDKIELSMKKLFKPDDKADDPDQDWIHTGHFVSFDPLEDDPDEMLEFVLSCTDN